MRLREWNVVNRGVRKDYRVYKDYFECNYLYFDNEI